MTVFTIPCNSPDPRVALAFGWNVDVPDSYGKPLRGWRRGSVLYVACEHGLFSTLRKKRNRWEMQNRALAEMRKRAAQKAIDNPPDDPVQGVGEG